MFEIRTERLLLRPARLEDANRMQCILADFEVAKNLARVPHPYPANAAIEWIERVMDNVEPFDAKFSIIDQDGHYCGSTGFSRSGEVPQLGYYLDPLHWGKGYMSEACKAVVGWIFDTANPDYIKSGVYPTNLASLAIQKKLGFVEIGRSTVHCLAQNADLQHIDTQLTKDAFVAATQ
ncbi:GNAT family N-acetyltransferase [Maritalea sp.]|uniref:GNAT family N-acetyltransferase n=1 Tax=Maritalea sp. TaxID=2003361 RepID=UPI003EF6024F